MNRDNVILIGPTGAGKSTVGRLLADELALNFYDSDEWIESQHKKTVAQIFADSGEAIFRQYEQQALIEMIKFSPLVLATGGGVVLKSENRQLLKDHGLVVYLAVSVEEQLARLMDDKHRPLLQVADRKEKLNEMHKIRTPLYQETAHICILTDSKDPEIIVQIIKESFKI